MSQDPAAHPPAQEVLTPTLHFLKGSLANKRVRLKTGSHTMGRGSENDLIVDDPGLSRVHLRLLVQGESVHVYDLGSTNGTYVAGKRVQQAALQSGDMIQVGNQLLLRFSLESIDPFELENPLPDGAAIDSLSGVANWVSWREQAGQMLADTLIQGKAVSLALCQLDRFPQLQEKFGPGAGDLVLTEFGRLARGLGRDILVGRYAGEIFGILLPGLASLPARARLQDLCSQVAATPLSESAEPTMALSLSVGLVTAIHPGQGQLPQLFREAGQALQQARQAGGNQVWAERARPLATTVAETAMLRLLQKRRKSRTRTQRELLVKSQGGELQARLRDVGVGGLSLRLPQAATLALGEELLIGLSSRSDEVVRAVVKWIRDDLVGVNFCDSPDTLRATWISRVLQELGVNAQNARDRRAYPRVEVEFPLTFQVAAVTYPAQVRSLGLDGLGAEAINPPQTDSEGVLELPGLRLTARVVWSRPPHFGLRFAMLSKAQNVVLRDLMRDRART